MRNEAHRFAHTFNRKLRRNRTLTSGLSEIRGIGPVRQRALLARFGSVRALRQAKASEIAEVAGFSERLAVQVLEQLRQDS
jgi:excinuclease ABC subunit C